MKPDTFSPKVDGFVVRKAPSVRNITTLYSRQSATENRIYSLEEGVDTWKQKVKSLQAENQKMTSLLLKKRNIELPPMHRRSRGQLKKVQVVLSKNQMEEVEDHVQCSSISSDT